MRARVLAYDVGLVLWAALWLVVAGLVWHDVRGLGRLSNTVVTASRALDETATGLSALESLPIVGESARIGQIRARIEATAASARTSAVRSRRDVYRLSWLLAVSIALVPTVPLLALYLPQRRAWRRDRPAR